MVDYYRVLGISREASESEIKKAFRRLAQQHHPDKSAAPDAAARFIRIAEAYEVLRDPMHRRAFDLVSATPDQTRVSTRTASPQQEAAFRHYATKSRAKAEEYSRMSWSTLASVVLDEAALHGKYAYHFGCGPLLFIGSGVMCLFMLPMMLSDDAFDDPVAGTLILIAACVGFIWFGVKSAKSLAEDYKAERRVRQF